MPTEPEPVTIAQVVHRAAEIVDPDGADDDVTEFLRRHEDADEPVTAVEDTVLVGVDRSDFLGAVTGSAESAGALDEVVSYRMRFGDVVPDLRQRTDT